MFGAHQIVCSTHGGCVMPSLVAPCPNLEISPGEKNRKQYQIETRLLFPDPCYFLRSENWPNNGACHASRLSSAVRFTFSRSLQVKKTVRRQYLELGKLGFTVEWTTLFFLTLFEPSWSTIRRHRDPRVSIFFFSRSPLVKKTVPAKIVHRLESRSRGSFIVQN